MAILNLNPQLFDKNIAEPEKPILVEFWAPWCVYCRRIAPALDKIAEQYSESLTGGQVNIDDEPQLAQKENIEVVPTLLLYRNGQKLGSITAPASKAAIETFLKEHLNG